MSEDQEAEAVVALSPAAKEIVEFLDGALVAVQDIKEVFANGRVGLEDLSVLFKINRQLPVLMAAINGLENVWPNIASVSADEVSVIEAKAMQLLELLGVKLPV